MPVLCKELKGGRELRGDNALDVCRGGKFGELDGEVVSEDDVTQCILGIRGVGVEETREEFMIGGREKGQELRELGGGVGRRGREKFLKEMYVIRCLEVVDVFGGEGVIEDGMVE